MSGNVQMALQVLPDLTLTRNLQVSPLVIISLISQMRKPMGVPSCICRTNTLAPLQGLCLSTVTFPASHHDTGHLGHMSPKVWHPTAHSWDYRCTHGSSHRALRTRTAPEQPVFLLVPAPTWEWPRLWRLLQVFLPGEFHGQRSLSSYSQWSHKDLDVTERLIHTHIHTHTRFLGPFPGA